MVSVQQSRAIGELVRGATQEQTARAAGVSVRTVQRWLDSPAFVQVLNEAKSKVVVEAGVSDMKDRMIGMLEKIVNGLAPALDSALAAGDLKNAAGIARELRGAGIDALRAAGELKPDTQVNVGIALVQSPEWQNLKAKLIAVLGPFPQARQALVAALDE